MISDEQIHASRILIVDDEALNTRLLEGILRRAGYDNVVSVNDASKVLAVYNDFSPDILLLDIIMPHKDGFQVMEELVDVQSKEYFPIIILTGLHDRETRLKALSNGAKDFLNKPLDRSEVITRIRNLLEVRMLFKIVNNQNEMLEERVAERTQALRLEVAERQKIEQENIRQATHDRLTGLPNETLLYGRIQETIDNTETARGPTALLLVALNRFHEINRTLGYQNGDQLLQQVATRLKNNLRLADENNSHSNPERDDIIARYSGGKFAVLLRNLDSNKSATTVANRILANMLEPFDIEGLSFEVTASIGIAIYPDHGKDVPALVRRSDVALDIAKQSNNPIITYSAEIDIYSPRRLALMAELRQAIQDNQLSLHFQPKVNISAGEVTGMEALLRWVHPEYKLIPPDEFIPLAEQSGLIKPLTTWVTNEAIKQAAGLIHSRRDILVSVNLSPSCLQDEDIVTDVEQLLRVHDMPPAHLVLEITESAVMRDPEYALEILWKLSSLGVKLSIDDFGTGYSSLAYLKRLPVNELKIDRAFVKDMVQDADDQVIVRTTIDLSHNLGLSVVAEGVEDQATVDALRELGCDEVQGYFYAKPMPIDELKAWLKQSKIPAVANAS